MKLIFRETDGVTGDRLTFGDGAVPDGSYLKRVGRIIVGDPGISGSVVHNNTTGKQGGQFGQYYHLTAAEYAAMPWVRLQNVTPGVPDQGHFDITGTGIMGDVKITGMAGVGGFVKNDTAGLLSGNNTINDTDLVSTGIWGGM